MIQSFSEYARNLIQEYEKQANEFIKMRVGFLIEIVDNEIASLSNSINALENRFNTEKCTQQGKRQESLERLIRQCEDINSSIEHFFETLTH